MRINHGSKLNGIQGGWGGLNSAAASSCCRRKCAGVLGNYFLGPSRPRSQIKALQDVGTNLVPKCRVPPFGSPDFKCVMLFSSSTDSIRVDEASSPGRGPTQIHFVVLWASYGYLTDIWPGAELSPGVTVRGSLARPFVSAAQTHLAE